MILYCEFLIVFLIRFFSRLIATRYTYILSLHDALPISRAVGTHQGGDPAGGDVDGDRADLHGLGVLLAYLVDGDHRRPFRMMTTRNTDPPTSSMMMETTPCA